MTRQDQSVGEGGHAIQSQGNVTVTYGITPDQMLEIMDGVERQVQRGVDRAAGIVDARLADFRKGVIEEFAKPESRGNIDAFNEPDFQYALKEAQKGFARSGEQGLKDELVKLLAQRSAEPSRTRTALILNEAIQTISSLTNQEVSALALIFLFCHARIASPVDQSDITNGYRRWITPFVDDFPSDDHSFEYLGSMRCLIVNQISHTDVWEAIFQNYSNIFTNGFTKATLVEFIKDENIISDFSEPIRNNFAGLIRFNKGNKEEFLKFAAEKSLDNSAIEGIKTLWDNTKIPDEIVRQSISSSFPQMATLAKNGARQLLSKAILLVLEKPSLTRR